jgi:hypothetical protein
LVDDVDDKVLRLAFASRVISGSSATLDKLASLAFGSSTPTRQRQPNAERRPASLYES